MHVQVSDRNLHSVVQVLNSVLTSTQTSGESRVMIGQEWLPKIPPPPKQCHWYDYERVFGDPTRAILGQMVYYHQGIMPVNRQPVPYWGVHWFQMYGPPPTTSPFLKGYDWIDILEYASPTPLETGVLDQQPLTLAAFLACATKPITVQRGIHHYLARRLRTLADLESRVNRDLRQRGCHFGASTRTRIISGLAHAMFEDFEHRPLGSPASAIYNLLKDQFVFA